MADDTKKKEEEFDKEIEDLEDENDTLAPDDDDISKPLKGSLDD